MCLSKVYVKDKTNDSVVADEAARVIETKDGVEVHTLFGESNTIEGCCIKEVDLLKNYVVLEKRGAKDE
jgi:predicted RNA-binding protein